MPILHLYGSHFEIHMDIQALSFLLKCRLNNGRMTRWILTIQEYNFTIKYIKTGENKVADTLSRWYWICRIARSWELNYIKILALKYKMTKEVKQQSENTGKKQDKDARIVRLKKNTMRQENPNTFIKILQCIRWWMTGRRLFYKIIC